MSESLRLYLEMIWHTRFLFLYPFLLVFIVTFVVEKKDKKRASLGPTRKTQGN